MYIHSMETYLERSLWSLVASSCLYSVVYTVENDNLYVQITCFIQLDRHPHSDSDCIFTIDIPLLSQTPKTACALILNKWCHLPA